MLNNLLFTTEIMNLKNKNNPFSKAHAAARFHRVAIFCLHYTMRYNRLVAEGWIYSPL